MFFYSRKNYKTLNVIEINKSAILKNYNYFKKLQPDSAICPVLKSNAYGHGLKLVGKFVDENIRPEFVCVDSLYEAFELKKIGFKGKILVIGYTFPENFTNGKINFSLPVYDLETLRILNKYQPGISVHLKIDTGMNRLGIRENEFEILLKEMKKCSKIKYEGIYSHLSDADNQNNVFTNHQVALFKKANKFFEENGYFFRYKHLLASAGAVKIFDPEFNLIRLGLGFYGLSPFLKTKQDYGLKENLSPALTFKSHLVSIKILKKDESLGYNQSYLCKSDMPVGILPLGYYDGLDRRLSNKGYVKIKDKQCRIIGNICMNVCFVDLSLIKNPKIKEEAVVYSGNTDDLNSISHSANLTKTIPYVLLANLSETTKRVAV